MSFIQLVQREMQGSLPRLLFMSALGGISTAAVLASINAGVQSVNGGNKPSLWAATLFLVALFLFMKTQAYVTITATAEIEGIIHRLRLRIMDQIRHSELLALDKIGLARIVASVTGDTQILTQASNMLCFTVQGAVLIFFVSFYVAYLSLAAFVMTFVIVFGAGIMFHLKNHRLSAQKAGVGGVGAPAVRPADRFSGRLQRSAAQQRAQRRAVRGRRRRVAGRGQYQDTDARPKPSK